MIYLMLGIKDFSIRKLGFQIPDPTFSTLCPPPYCTIFLKLADIKEVPISCILTDSALYYKHWIIQVLMRLQLFNGKSGLWKLKPKFLNTDFSKFIYLINLFYQYSYENVKITLFNNNKTLELALFK